MNVVAWFMGSKGGEEHLSGLFLTMEHAKELAEKFIQETNTDYAKRGYNCYSEAEERKGGWIWSTSDGMYLRLETWPVGYR